jgi:hypothetical protein
MEEYIKLGSKSNIIDTFDEQDNTILSKVKKENTEKVKNIIAEYGLNHSLNPIFRKYKDDYDGLQNALLEFSKRRLSDLLELTKNF